MTDIDLAALATDAERVHDAVATVKWWARGVLVGAGSADQAEEARRALGVLERSERASNVVALELARMRDMAATPAGTEVETREAE